MINGQLGQWLDEARQHGHHVIAAAAAMREVLLMKEWIRVAVVAVVTSVVTSQVTIARLDERITALKNEREIIVRNRDGQMAELKARDTELKGDIEKLTVLVRRIENQMRWAK